MTVLNILNNKAEKVSQIDLLDEIFCVPIKPSVMHEVVVMQLAKKRLGTATVKHRSDIVGSTKKLFRQKGTGNARRGNIKSPLLRGGGSVFGPDMRSYSYKVPKKIRKLALKMALSCKLKENEMILLDQFGLDEIKTKELANILDRVQAKNTLIVIDKRDENLELSARNIPGVKVIRYEGLNVYDILKYKNIIIMEPAVKAIEGRLTA